MASNDDPSTNSRIPGFYDQRGHARCIDGPLQGGVYSLHFTHPINWLGPRGQYPYRGVEDDDGTWYFVYADALDDDLPGCVE